MAERIADVIDWLSEFDPDWKVGVDAGGLTLRVVAPDVEPNAWYDIGGLPEED